MKRFIASVLAAFIVAAALPAWAGDNHGTSSKPKAHAEKQHKKTRVYGTPIQPPIVKKVRTKRGHANQASKAETERKAKAAAARRRANEAYRRANPASGSPQP